MHTRTLVKFMASATALATAITFSACGGAGASSSGNTTSSPSGTSSPTYVTAGDAPMSSVVSALVTVSAVTMTSSSGTVQLLSQPRQVELTHLGGIREPLGLKALPDGTYTGLSLTVSAATITYIDPNTQQPVTAQATIPASSATASLTLNPAVTVDDSTATDVRFDFDLKDSLDLTNNVVTFTPTLAAAVARVKNESAADRDIDISGTITAVSTTANTITLTTDDTGMTVTLNVTSNTMFDGGLSLNSLQVGSQIASDDQLNSDGSITAMVIEPSNGGQGVSGNTRVDNGLIVTATRDANNNLTAFTMVVRDSYHVANIGKLIAVTVGQGTTFNNSMEAQSAGITSWDQSQVIPGAAVWVTSSGNAPDSATTVASRVRPAQVNPSGLTSAAVQTASGGSGLVISVLLDANSFYDQIAHITTLSCDTNANTIYDGDGLTSAGAANLAVGSPLVVRGFLTVSGSTNTLFATHVHEEGGSVF